MFGWEYVVIEAQHADSYCAKRQSSSIWRLALLARCSLTLLLAIELKCKVIFQTNVMDTANHAAFESTLVIL